MIQCLCFIITDWRFQELPVDQVLSGCQSLKQTHPPDILGFAAHNLNAFIMLIWPQVMKGAESNSPRIPPKKHHSFNQPGEKRVQLEQKPSYQPSRRPSFPAVSSSQSREIEMAGAQLRLVSGANVPRIRLSCEPEPSDLVRLAEQLYEESRGRNPGRPNKGLEIERDVTVAKVCLR